MYKTILCLLDCSLLAIQSHSVASEASDRLQMKAVRMYYCSWQGDQSRSERYFQKRVTNWTEKLSDLDETRNLSSLDHCAQHLVVYIGFPRAQRAEISAEGAKMDKNARVARIFAPISMKLGTYDLQVMMHK